MVIYKVVANRIGGKRQLTVLVIKKKHQVPPNKFPLHFWDKKKIFFGTPIYV